MLNLSKIATLRALVSSLAAAALIGAAGCARLLARETQEAMPLRSDALPQAGTLPQAVATARPELVLQQAPERPVQALAFSPDGHTLASGSEDGLVKLWQAADGGLKRTLRGHRSRIVALSFSSDGHILASGAGDRTVKLWNSITGSLLRTLRGSQGGVTALAFSPDASLLAGGSSNDRVLLWSVATGKLLHTWQQPKSQYAGIVTLAFAPDGQILAAANQSGTTQLWDVRNGTLKRTLAKSKGGISLLRFRLDGTLVMATGSEIKVWNAASGQLLEAIASPITKMHDPPSDEMDVMDPGGWRDYPIGTLAVADDGHTAIGFCDRDIKVWDITTRQVVRTWPEFLHHTAMWYWRHEPVLALSCDGQQAAGGTGELDETGEVHSWSITDGKKQWTRIGWQAGTAPMGFSRDGNTLVSVVTDHTIRLWDAHTGRLKRTFQAPVKIHDNGLCRAALSPNGRWLAGGDGSVGSEYMARIWLWDAHTGVLRHTLVAHRESVDGLVFSPDSRQLLSGGGTLYKGDVCVWDVASGKLLHRMGGHEGGVEAVAISPDGKLAASGSFDNTVKLWSVQSGALVRTLKQYGGYVEAVAFSPDGKTVAGGHSLDPDGEIKVWDTRTGRAKRTFQARGGDIGSLHFSSDGTSLTVGCQVPYERNASGHAYVFDTRTGQSRATLTIGTAAGWVDFSPDEHKLLSGNWNGLMELRNAHSGQLLATFLVVPTHFKGASSDWLVFTPDGYYDGSPGAENFIRWRVGDQLFPAATYAATFHRPDLVQKALQ